MFASRLLRAASSVSQVASAAAAAPFARSKASTHITGLAVHPSPLSSLKETYAKTLSILSTMPDSSVYRQATEALTSHRASVVERAVASGESEEAIGRVEQELDAGLIEEVVIQAEDEQKLATKMLEWKPWEPLEHQPPRNQWIYFKPADE